jgi:hypothetical protein
VPKPSLRCNAPSGTETKRIVKIRVVYGKKKRSYVSVEVGIEVNRNSFDSIFACKQHALLPHRRLMVL